MREEEKADGEARKKDFARLGTTGKRGKENKKDEGTTDFKKQTLFISH